MSVLDMLEEAGAVYTKWHFVYKSGRHGPVLRRHGQGLPPPADNVEAGDSDG